MQVKSEREMNLNYMPLINVYELKILHKPLLHTVDILHYV